VALHQLLGRLRAQAAREQRVVTVQLARPLLAGQAHLVCVHDHHEVAGVGVSREGRAVLTAQHVGDLRRRAAERLAFDVGDEPGFLERRVGLIRRAIVRGGCGHGAGFLLEGCGFVNAC